MLVKNKKNFIIASFILSTLFLILSFWVSKDVFRGFDYQILVQLQNNISRQVDVPFSILTILGSTEITLVVLIAIFLSSLFKYRHLFLSLLLYFLIFLIELWGKLFIFHPDPPVTFNRYALDLHLPSSFIVHTNFSYPSGHVARTTFLIIIISFFLYKWQTPLYKKTTLGIMFLFLLAMILISRIYLGEHWFSDVLGGFILGTSISTLAIGFW